MMFRRFAFVIVGLGSMAACQRNLSQASCPCIRGWICCSSQNVCLRPDEYCPPGHCGNGVTERDLNELCDDGAANGFPGYCALDCRSVPKCGNGNIDEGEVCDDGPMNGLPGHCSVGCKGNGLCGNGILDIGEDCDYCTPDAGTVNDNVDAGPSPWASCTFGFKESRTCNRDCTTSWCGDGKINHAAGEQCDDRGESAVCNIDCTVRACGDAKVNRVAGEECDVEGGADTRSCNGAAAGSVGCRFARCGDGHVNAAAGETCDVLGGEDTPDCNGSSAPIGVACRPPTCSNAYVNRAAGEPCEGGVDGG